MRPAGFVLVGGLSTRMGRDKALLSAASHPHDLHPLIADVAAKVAVAAGSVALVGKPERYRNLGLDCVADYITDLRPDLGPLAGIEAALETGRGDANLIVACDMPGLTAALLGTLLRRAEETDAICTVARDSSGAIHPLCAVYRSACLPIVRRALDTRRLRLMDVIQELGAAVCDIDGIIWNVNTPQEWSAWQSQQFSPEGAPAAAPNGN